MKRYFIPSLVSALCIFSCAKSTDISGNVNDKSSFAEQVTDITANIDVFVSDDQTKSSFDPITKTWSWTVDDQLGFWSDPKNEDKLKLGNATQVVFDVTSTDPAQFHGNGFGVIRGCTYYTYYPYDKNADSTQVSISYLGQNPKSNGGYDHLGKYDYLYSSGKAQSSGDVSFTYHHKGCIAKFTITVNTGANVGNITKFTLSTNDSSNQTLVQGAVYNPFDPAGFINRICTSSIDFPLGDKKDGVYQGVELQNKQLVVYAMMSPAAMSGKKFTATLIDADGNTYQGSSAKALSNNQQAGKIYGYSINVSNPEEFSDLSDSECANCYIVPAPGKYKFKIRRCGESSDIANVASADLYWETVNTTTAPTAGAVISDVNYDNGYITFTKPSPYIAGNALIVAKNSGGTILWSWHIWSIQTYADEVYRNNAGTLMDRNLGALERSGDTAAGLLYQWGRKDPFIGHYPLVTNTAAEVTGTSLSNVARSTAGSTNTDVISYSEQHPAAFITSDFDWLPEGHPATEGGLWHNSDGSKAKYDPCPPGYKVPDGSRTNELGSEYFNQWGFFAKAVNNNLNLTGVNDGTHNGFVIDSSAGLYVARGGSYLGIPMASGYNALFPYTGYISEGGTRTVGYVQIWSDYHYSEDAYTAHWSKTHPACLNVDFNNLYQFYVNWNSGRGAGKAVRCQKMIKLSLVGSNQANESLSSQSSPSEW